MPPDSVPHPRREGPGGHRALALLLYVLTTSAAVAAPPDVLLDDSRDLWPMGQRMSVLEDPSETLTLEEVSRGEFAHRFVRSPMETPAYGYSRGVCWVRFSYLEQGGSPSRRWLLAVGDPTLEHVDVYFQFPDGSFEVRRAGSRVPWAEREVAHKRPVFHLPEARLAPVTVYARLQTSLVLRAPVSILTPERLVQDNAASLIPWWLYLGVLASMVLYNTVLFFFLKDRVLLYYILYITFSGLGIGLAFTGAGYEYFPDGASWLERLVPAFLHLSAFFGPLFASSFLNSREATPRLDRLMLALAAVSGVFAVLTPFFPARVSQIAVNAVALAQAPVLIVMSIIIWRQGFQPARFVLAGWLILVVSGMLAPFYTHGLLPGNIVTHHLLMIGSTLEMILFALALANRINEAKKESEEARHQALEGEIHRLRNIELRQANEEILRKQDQLIQAEKMASLGELTAGVAHEIKNPLNFINNFSLSLIELMDELRQELKDLPGEKRAGIEPLATECKLTAEKIAEHGERANGIVRSMLEHASVRPGERRLTDLNRLIEEHIRLVHGSWRQRFGAHVSVQTTLEPGLPRVQVIPQELGRVLLNLLNNAFQAVGEQRKRGRDDYAPLVRVSTHSKDGKVEIRVQDNGIGIPSTLRGRIFEPFFTTKPHGVGVGLGLSLSYGIITKRHEGTLDFDSTEGEGTTFVIALPVQG